MSNKLKFKGNGKLRVLMIIPNFYPYFPTTGGAERQCLKLSKELIKIGINVEVLTYRLKSDWPTREDIFGIKITRLCYLAPNELNLPIWLYHLWKMRNNYDIFHIHLFNGAHFVAASWVARLYRKLIVVKIANSGERFDVKSTYKLRWPLKKLVLRSLFLSNRIIAISESIKRELIELNIPNEKIVSIPNGVEVVGLSSDHIRIQQRKELQLPKDAMIVLRVGSLTLKKGLKFLFEAWYSIKEKWPDALLVSVGGDKLPDYCIKIEEDPHSQVRFYLNQQEGVLPFLQSADIFILPSLAEGLSNALLEAQSCGLPCIATRVGGNSDIICDGVNGILIEPRSIDEIVDSLEKLMESQELRITYGLNAIKKSYQYDIGTIAQRYFELYNSIV